MPQYPGRVREFKRWAAKMVDGATVGREASLSSRPKRQRGGRNPAGLTDRRWRKRRKQDG